MSIAETSVSSASEGFVQLGTRRLYRIPDFDRLNPFLMSLTSDGDLWMYVSSAGSLAAGRGSEEQSLFPYETDDKIHQMRGITGPVTLLRIGRPGGETLLWEPFAAVKPEAATRNLYKSPLGNCILFEETHAELGMTFRYAWAASAQYGFVRTCWLELSEDAELVDVELLDGLSNLLPAGVALATQQIFSCLTNAYSQHEIDGETGLGLFTMASRIVDRAEPAESLTANTVWTCGLRGAKVTLAPQHADHFRAGQAFTPITQMTGRRGAYLIHTALRLEPGTSSSWHIVADANRTQAAVVALRKELLKNGMASRLEQSLKASDDKLQRLVSSADGSQASGNETTAAHHAANVLFNIMRGGVFHDGYSIAAADFAAFVAQRNSTLATQHRELLDALPARLDYADLLHRMQATEVADLERLTYEYLPLTFSRRHGDPSRPWNRFAIRVTNPDGSSCLAYQGNWRDIFQNWEALCSSYPEFLIPIIAKFVNASTLDGFNAYRLSREGIDWETPEPHNPWSNIGYWGDHQTIYLLKLMEAADHRYPGWLQSLLDKPIFSYADVPYRLKPYAQILANPHETIAFDWDAHRTTTARAQKLGGDGRLVHDSSGQVLKVTLLEKLLVSVLARLSNLVLDGGIWMNSQRPEWNDANNALVGNGISMVTLCYLRRQLAFLLAVLPETTAPEPRVNGAVLDWLAQVDKILRAHESVLASQYGDDQTRKALLDELGEAFEAYRNRAYAGKRGAARPVALATVRNTLALAQRYLDHAIRANRRIDGLYHSYNLLALSADGKQAGIETMHEMLEGQVAVLSSGLLNPQEAIEVLQALYASKIYRPDQDSFMLYPVRRLPGFLEKNTIAPGVSNPLLAALVQEGDQSVVVRDAAGKLRFAPEHANAKSLAAALDKLQQPGLAKLVQQHRQEVLDLYEQVFHHRSFTGRSGAMYGYEGIGCIYWHMVAKLLLAVQECYQSAVAAGAPAGQIRDLAIFYGRVRSGLGFRKSALKYGAFPTDPYSHTPGHAGAQQPGMTGQVKEEILCRWGELGVLVQDGRIRFAPTLLDDDEWLEKAQMFRYLDCAGQWQTLKVQARELAFTLCQTPVVYHRGAKSKIVLTKADGSRREIDSDTLDAATSARIFGRSGTIARIDVTVC